LNDNSLDRVIPDVVRVGGKAIHKSDQKYSSNKLFDRSTFKMSIPSMTAFETYGTPQI
jgi:tRNA(His) 5'-end guanylyltransferase